MVFQSIRFQSTGYGGTLDTTHDPTKVAYMRRIEDTVLKIRFNADIGSSMRWNFKPQQYEIKVNLLRSQVLQSKFDVKFYHCRLYLVKRHWPFTKPATRPTSQSWALALTMLYRSKLANILIRFNAFALKHSSWIHTKKYAQVHKSFVMILNWIVFFALSRSGWHASVLLHWSGIRKRSKNGIRGPNHAVVHVFRIKRRHGTTSSQLRANALSATDECGQIENTFVSWFREMWII